MEIILKRKWFIGSKLYNINNDYIIGEEIGRGAHGKVFKCVHKQTSQTRAIKVIQKSSVSDYETFITEISILKDLDHPNIVKIIETFECARLCHLVLEYYNGGDLFDRIIKDRRFSELKASLIMRSLLSAVRYFHIMKVCHRDLKPENCLYISTADDSDIKIIDFGLSAITSETEALHDPQGTPYYLAPEVLMGSYNQKADCWSLGVILYMLFSGTPPFNGSTNEEILLSVYNASLNFRKKAFRAVSPAAKDLISRLLMKDPEYRISAEEAFNHVWISGCSPPKAELLPVELVENIEKFVKSRRLKKVALMFIASKLSEQEISFLRETFKKIDINGDGFISKEELKLAMIKFQDVCDAELEHLANSLDFNFNGMIDYTEFITACLQAQNYTNRGLLKSAFAYFDKDQSGFITFNELREAISGNDIGINDNSKIEEMIREADKNNDGKIDYSEFLELMSVKSFISTF
jgi:calcium-dependent protein kinase